MSFGKPGRPPEDRTLRRRQIYLAIAPLIEQVGYRGLSMKAAARAAHLSIGGLYHYFPTKRDLVLHPLTTDFGSRYCTDLNARYAALLHTDPERYARLKIRGTARVMMAARPAVLAAVEMGLEAYRSTVETGLSHGLLAFESAVGHLEPTFDADTIHTMSRSMRRILMAAVLDRTTTEAEVAADLELVFDAHLDRSRRAATAVA
ncbi:transcriptional regulator, TetR family [Cryptosporangium aurantiacum]|uniref:Transcriptional regulator, TetR family n=2 Tax=Cryptosporangium aurantiacum TaxID=134849 RepID=A0A1M7MKK8_9ACTN|nr:transcriptional regulator, TetR family [Cryptosporangium aurantiacum]